MSEFTKYEAKFERFFNKSLAKVFFLWYNKLRAPKKYKEREKRK